MRLLLILLLLIGIWAVFIEPRWVAHRIQDTTLPDGKKRGLKILHTADWHLSKQPLWRVMTHGRAADIIEDINQVKPDIILITGDLIAEPRQKTTFGSSIEDEIASTLGKLQASKGVYAVLGNHDNWYNHQLFKAALTKHGIHVLENKALYLKQENLWIAGIGDESTNHADAKAALKSIPRQAAALIMMHDPATLLDMPTRPNSFSFAGHTHGGQVSIPFYGALIMPSRAPASWAYGWIKHKHNHLYVISGLGVSVLPLRFNMRPEWVELNI